MTFDYPPAKPGDLNPSAAQRAAVEDFYGFALEGHEREAQAHALLTYRDYARVVAERLYPTHGKERRLIVARMIAAFVSVSLERRADVMRWADRRWRDARDPDSRVASISRTKHFSAIEAFMADAIADMQEAGAAL